jgi:hypothetical protein
MTKALWSRVMGPMEEFKVQKFKVQGGERGNVEHGTLNL